MPTPTNLSDIEGIRMVFGWREEEFDSLSELHSAERGVGEVVEHAQDHRDRYEP